MKRIAFLSVLCFSLLFACKKSDVGPGPAPASGEAVQYPVGQPLGNAVSKTIGAAGGSLQTADGRCSIIVPAGAVSSATQFSIQPVTNTLSPDGAPAYRLLPEGLAFQQPLTVTLSFAGADLRGTTPEQLSLVYQDAEGFFNLARATVVDKVQQKLTVQTKHFSDWSFVELMALEADRYTLKPGESAGLVLKYYNYYQGNNKLADPKMGKLREYDVTGSVTGLKWRLSVGQGSLQPSGARCRYTAPASVPAQNPALISVYIPTYNPAQGDFSIESILTTSIAVVDDEFVSFTVDGVTHLNEPVSEHGVTMEADGFNIMAQMTSGTGMYLYITGGAGGKGSFAFGNGEKKSQIDLGLDAGEVFTTRTHDCEMCDERFSSGGINITRFDGVGGYVEGTFRATVWRLGEPGAPGKAVEGSFRLKRLN